MHTEISRIPGGGFTGRLPFVRKERLEMTREKVTTYKRFRELTREWVDLEVKRERLERDEAKKKNVH